MRVSRATLAVACTVTLALSGATRSLQAQTRWGRCMVGVSYGAPLKMALSYATGRVIESDGEGADVCNYASAKVGIGGARLALGTSRTINALGGGAGASIGLLRTFGTPLHAQPWRNHVGVAVHVIPALGFGGELGYYVRIGNNANGAPATRVITWSAGFGF